MNASLTDATLRLLRAISRRDGGMFAGNHNCRRDLEAGGYIRIAEKDGQWTRLFVTDKGLAALGAA